jgi:hypothetical protein
MGLTFTGDASIGAPTSGDIERLMAQIASIIIRTNKTRAQTNGLNVDFSQMKAYSKAYLPVRREAGRSAEVNLTFTGRMWQALSTVRKIVSQFTGSVEVGWTGEDLKKAIKLFEDRPFFGVDTIASDEIDKNTDKWITEILKR